MKNLNEHKNKGRLHGQYKAASGDPIELLTSDHEEAGKILAYLDNAIESIRTSGFSAEAFHQVEEALRSLDREVRHHQEIEEKYMLPVLEQHGFDGSSTVRNERRELWSSFNQLQLLVQDIEEGRLHGSSIAELVNESKTIIDALKSQIKVEQTLLFPSVKELFTKKEYQHLSDSIINAVATTL